jgi:hypothetical protein
MHDELAKHNRNISEFRQMSMEMLVISTGYYGDRDCIHSENCEIYLSRIKNQVIHILL